MMTMFLLESYFKYFLICPTSRSQERDLGKGTTRRTVLYHPI